MAANKELKSAPSPTKNVKFTLVIRVYGEGYKTQSSHGYVLDDLPMGVSDPVVTMPVNIRILTLQQLRPILMYDQRNRMKKRSVVWQEVLFIFGRLPNIYDRPKSELNLYQFGFCRKDNVQDIQLVHPSYEDRSIAELIGATDFFSHDLIIVPLTQISPEVQNAPPPGLPEIDDKDQLGHSKDGDGCKSSSGGLEHGVKTSSSNVSLEGGAPKKKKVKKKKVIKDGQIVDKIIE
jgi:hypothetical protein